jgi:small-conductance mechanosensitive channel
MPRIGRLAAGGTLIACLAASPLAAQGTASALRADDTRARNLSAYLELLRSDIREQKVALISGMMQFSEADDQKFWPVYREYEGELSAINDERLALIKEYAQAFEKMTDQIANRLAHAVLDLEARRNALKTKYYERLATVLPARTAARVLQVENQILLLLDLQIAASLPVIE